jgi:predicted hydrocarbon binding protein
MSDTLAALHNIAYFVSALACASETNIGRGSHSICALAGKRFGREATKDVEQTDDPIKAIDLLREALKKQGIVWEFEPFDGEKETALQEQDGKKNIRLAFRTCMVRNALFRYSHEQKQSLCYMAHGVFAGAMEQILPGYNADLEIIHAGPNACLKELHLEVKK